LQLLSRRLLSSEVTTLWKIFSLVVCGISVKILVSKWRGMSLPCRRLWFRCRKLTPLLGREPGAAFEAQIVNVVNLLVGNYNITKHNACKGLWGGRLNRIFELAGVLCQPRPKPIVRKRKTAAAVFASTPKKATEKRRRVRGSSRSEDRTSAKELALAKPLKQSKKFVSHSSRPSSTGAGSAAQAPAHALDLFDSGSSASDAEPTDPVPPRKRP
jgi:hypothetical protein